MKDKSLYINRELSWLMFNERVLQEAKCPDTPLFERLRFVAIFAENLDEFFMIRVGSLVDQMLLKDKTTDSKTNMTAKEQLNAIFLRVHELVPIRDRAFNEICALLKKKGVSYLKPSNADEKELKFLKLYFEKEILPLCSAQIIEGKLHFPFLDNKKLFVGAHLASKNGIKLGIVAAEGGFKRVIRVPGKKLKFFLAEDVIEYFADKIFRREKIISTFIFRVTRNADIDVNDIGYDEPELDYRTAMSQLLQKRKKLSPVRLEVSKNTDRDIIISLAKKLKLSEKQVFLTESALSFGFMEELEGLISDKSLFNSPLEPQPSPMVNPNQPIIPQILKKDIFLHYPYESMDPLINLISEAADDPKVVSIKITLYRLASESRIVMALIKAAQAGKKVYTSLELRARFDEGNNIDWSKVLEKAGVHVSYGLADYKVHSKIMLITRKSPHGREFITQIGTGNYNEKTARLYTDMCIMTANKDIGLDAADFFDALFTESLVANTRKLLVAPLCLKNRIISLIEREMLFAKLGKQGKITLKFNSLSDKELIDKLIEASKAGVKINMIVRGICCLKPGVFGETDNIRVISIVGRFLEHSRVYCFGEGDREEIFISSADFMSRNTERRIEIAVPVLSPIIKRRIKEILSVCFSDNVKSRLQLPDGSYTPLKAEGNDPLDSQLYFYKQAYEAADNKPKGRFSRIINFFRRIKGE